jgi:hypothetical protein
MANLILRTLTRPGDTTKSSPLTNAEVDQNFINLDVDLDTKAPLNGAVMTNVDINSGAIDGTTIGAASASTGRFSSVGVTDTTASTSTTTGALTVAGGIGVAGKINATDLQVTNTITGSISGNAASATQLQTARTINGTNFSGSANITTANWGTARNITIGSTAKSVNGSANVAWSLAEIGAAASSDTVNLTGDQTVAGVKSFSNQLRVSNGTAAAPSITFTSDSDTGLFWSTSGSINFSTNGVSVAQLSEGGGIPSFTIFNNGRVIADVFVGNLSGNASTATTATSASTAAVTASSTNSDFKVPFANTTASTTGSYGLLQDSTATFTYNPSTNTLTVGTVSGALSGNATTATTLATARTINGTSFNGSANITTANWGTTRDVTIGNTTKSINGSANVAWSLAEIGAASAATAVTLTGSETVTNKTFVSSTMVDGTLAGDVNITGSTRYSVVAVPALAIDCSQGNYFTKTISANSTFTFTNAPAGAYGFILELTHTSGSVTWPASVRWPGSAAPSILTGKVHMFMFITDDGGTSWRGSSVVNYNT